MEDSASKKKKSPTAATVSTTDSGTREDLKALSMDDLTSLLNEVLEQEDYIRAIAIRDEINSRRKTR
jgi:protein-arginine kinase activator protein McsA